MRVSWQNDWNDGKMLNSFYMRHPLIMKLNRVEICKRISTIKPSLKALKRGYVVIFCLLIVMLDFSIGSPLFF
jgi:hypothetical protein